MPKVAIIYQEAAAKKLTELLSAEDIEVDTFYSADTALPAVESTLYDLILLNSFVAPGINYGDVDDEGVIGEAMTFAEESLGHNYAAEVALHVLDRIRADSSPNKDTVVIMHNILEEYHPIYAELMRAVDSQMVQYSPGLLTESNIIAEVREALGISLVAQ